MTPTPLFSEVRAENALQQRLAKLTKAVAALPEDRFELGTDEQIVGEITGTSPLSVPRLLHDGSGKRIVVSRASGERDLFLFTFNVGFMGDKELFGWTPSAVTNGARPQAVVTPGELVISYCVDNHRPADQIVEAGKRRLEGELDDITRHLGWLADDIKQNAPTVRNTLLAHVAARRQFFARLAEINRLLQSP